MEKTIVDEVQEKWLKYFGHVNRWPVDSAVFQANKGDFAGKRPTWKTPSTLDWSNTERHRSPNRDGRKKNNEQRRMEVLEIEQEQGALLPKLISQVKSF